MIHFLPYITLVWFSLILKVSKRSMVAKLLPFYFKINCLKTLLIPNQVDVSYIQPKKRQTLPPYTYENSFFCLCQLWLSEEEKTENTNSHVFKALSGLEIYWLRPLRDVERTFFRDICLVCRNSTIRKTFTFKWRKWLFLYLRLHTCLHDCPRGWSFVFDADKCDDKIPIQYKTPKHQVDLKTRRNFEYAS